jgi:hypothetical protein
MGRGSAAPVTGPNDGVLFIRVHSPDGKLG